MVRTISAGRLGVSSFLEGERRRLGDRRCGCRRELGGLCLGDGCGAREAGDVRPGLEGGV
jgi:hypothetical protein